MASIQIQDVSKHFGRVKALHNLSLEVHEGEFLILLGPTGAGKTTTLRCVAGLEKPDAGDICMDGRSVLGLSPSERDVAFVFQSYALYPRKTVMENMAFPLEARKLPRSDIQRRVREVADKLAIASLLERRPAELSGGQQQRVALGRAMVRQPQLFLMDEPLTNLDFKLRVEMRAELKRLQKELNATFFYVTNDQVEAMSMADRVAVLDKGALQQADTPETIYSHPANLFVAGFIGNPRINLLQCRVDPAARVVTGRNESWQLALDAAQFDRLAQRGVESAAALTFGVRPEEVELLREPQPDAAPGTVYVVEPLGDRTIVDVRLGEDMVKVKAAPTFEASSGDNVWLRFFANRVHLFDHAGQTLI